MLISNFFKSFFILVLLSCASCLNNNSNSNPGGIRIVDLNGNPREVRRYIPEGNAQILSTQNARANQSINLTQDFATNPSANISIKSSFENQEMLDTKKVSTKITAPQPLPRQNIESQPFEENIESQEDISFDLSQTKTKEARVIETAIVAKATSKVSAPSNKKFKFVSKRVKKESVNKVSNKYFVQIGAFSSLKNANKSLTKGRKILEGKIKTTNKKDKAIHYVLLGPISKKNSKSMLKKVKEFGYKDAFIVK